MPTNCFPSESRARFKRQTCPLRRCFPRHSGPQAVRRSQDSCRWSQYRQANDARVGRAKTEPRPAERSTPHRHPCCRITFGSCSEPRKQEGISLLLDGFLSAGCPAGFHKLGQALPSSRSKAALLLFWRSRRRARLISSHPGPTRSCGSGDLGTSSG